MDQSIMGMLRNDKVFGKFFKDHAHDNKRAKAFQNEFKDELLKVA